MVRINYCLDFCKKVSEDEQSVKDLYTHCCSSCHGEIEDGYNEYKVVIIEGEKYFLCSCLWFFYDETNEKELLFKETEQEGLKGYETIEIVAPYKKGMMKNGD